MILVSACLLGINAKYNLSDNKNELLLKYTKQGRFIPFCPEQLGGLPTPRQPVEIIGGSGEDVLEGRAKVADDCGRDLTSQFKLGAEQVLALVNLFPITSAILKERSPSCGVNSIYNGKFTHSKINGQGVATALLRKNDVFVCSEEQLSEELIQHLLACDNSGQCCTKLMK